MDSPSRLGLELLAAALVLGVAGDLLLRAEPWGLNVSLLAFGIGLAGFGLLFRWRPDLARAERWMILPVFTLALLFMGRDAPMLKVGTVFALTAALVLTAQRAQAQSLRAHPSIPHQPPGLPTVFVKALLRLPVFLNRGIDWRSLSTEEEGRMAIAAGQGLLIALPVLAVFGGLLVAADATFEALVTRIFQVDAASLPGHVVLTAVLAWVIGGFLYAVLFRLDPPDPNAPEPVEPADDKERRFGLGLVEIGVVLGLVNVLFIAFIVVQLSYLFGGHGTVLGTPDLTVADYARRGFFELVTVVALALPFLMGLRRLLDVRAVHDLRRFHVLAGVHLGLLALLLASAGQRMFLYQQVFGLTEMRLYVSAILVWLAFVLGWFAWTALRDRAERFVPGAVVAGIVVVIGLHAINPDAIIVRLNVARSAEGRDVDAGYLTQLSADAVPALLDALPALPPESRTATAASLLHRWRPDPAEPPNWRTWSRSRALARHAVAAHAAQLQGYAREEGRAMGEEGQAGREAPSSPAASP